MKLDRHPSREDRRARSVARRPARIAAREAKRAAAEKANRERRALGLPTPWEQAKAARFIRRHPTPKDPS